MIIQQLQTKQINCAVYLLLTTQGQSHQSTHVSLRYNNLITLQHSLWTKNTSCLATNVVRINYHYCAIYNKGRRVTTQKEECKRTNNERQIVSFSLLAWQRKTCLSTRYHLPRANNFVFITHHVRLP